MKENEKTNINEELQISLDALSQTIFEAKNDLSDIKANLTKFEEKLMDSHSSNGNSLNTDLLNKILEITEQAKKCIDIEDLKKFTTAILSAQIQLQEETNNKFSGYLNEKMEEFDRFVKQPNIIKNQYSIDFTSSKTFISIIAVSIALIASLFTNYNQYQNNQNLSDNDLKYRYIKMANGIMPEDLLRLENFFYYTDSTYIIDNIRKSVQDYEYKLKIQAQKLEQIRRKEQEVQRLKDENITTQ